MKAANASSTASGTVSHAREVTSVRVRSSSGSASWRKRFMLVSARVTTRQSPDVVSPTCSGTRVSSAGTLADCSSTRPVASRMTYAKPSPGAPDGCAGRVSPRMAAVISRSSE